MSSQLYVSWLYSRANRRASSRIEISRQMRRRNVSLTSEKKAQTLTWWLGFPISVLLIGMIYTSTKALKFLSIPVYTIFKNLTIILIAYGEVLWFGGSVTPMALFSFGLMVLSSVIAAWADIKHALESHGQLSAEATAQIATLNAGYIWMLSNCLCTAAYVLGMRKRIKLTNFKDFDSKRFKHLHCGRILTIASHVLQQSPYNSYPFNRFGSGRGLVVGQHLEELPYRYSQHHYCGYGLLWAILRVYLLHICMVCSRYVFDDIFYGGSTQQAAYCCIRIDLLRCPSHHSECVCYLRGVREWHCLRCF